MRIQNISMGVCLLVTTSFTNATTWTVDDDGGADFNNIQAAVNVATNGDTILVAPGTYTGSGDNVVDTNGKAIWLRSSGGPEVTIINGQGVRTGIHCHSGETIDTKIEGFTVTNCLGTGTDDSGGGMRNSFSHPTILGCLFTSNLADFGGGMFNYNCSPTITDCIFTGNVVAYGGGGMGGNSNPILTGCRFSNNSATYGGGIEVGGGNPTLINTIVCNNSPDQINGPWIDGGGNVIHNDCALYVPSDYATIQEAINAASDGDIIEIAAGTYPVNSAILTGGKAITIRGAVNGDGSPAVTIDGQNSTRVVYSYGDIPKTVYENLVIANGQDGDGGGMRIENGSPTITNCTFRSNTCTSGTGGGIYAVGTDDGAAPVNSVITNCRFEDNQAIPFGGGIFTRPGNNMTFNNCSFTNNSATDSGGGIWDESESPAYNNCIFENNVATNFGGGIVLNGTSVQLDGCSFINNVANFGGNGVSFGGESLTIRDSEFISGGLHLGGGTALMERCVIMSNTEGVRASTSNLSLLDCLLEGNSTGIAVTEQSGTITLEGTMVTGNSGGIYCETNNAQIILIRSRVCGNGVTQIDCEYQDGGCNLVALACPSTCPDVTDDGIVNIQDILTLIAAWETCTPNTDLNFDGTVDISDLLLVIAGWGPCP